MDAYGCKCKYISIKQLYKFMMIYDACPTRAFNSSWRLIGISNNNRVVNSHPDTMEPLCVVNRDRVILTLGWSSLEWPCHPLVAILPLSSCIFGSAVSALETMGWYIATTCSSYLYDRPSLRMVGGYRAPIAMEMLSRTMHCLILAAKHDQCTSIQPSLTMTIICHDDLPLTTMINYHD